MSDFFNSGWSIFVAVATLASIVACLVLLFVASRRKAMAADNTTGHVWDGDLRELNNPLPLWWMGLFVLTVVFSVAYLLIYPGLGSHPGGAGWTQIGEYESELDQARRDLAPLYAQFDALGIEQLAGDPRARGVGERLFINNCAQCHGSDARGSKGFPDLTDRDWLYGDSAEKIIETITSGRQGAMPPLAAAVGGEGDVRNVAHYVLSLSGSPHNRIQAYAGRSKFAVCAGCHGADGRGNQAMGAPDLTDKVWLHGWGEQAIVDMVTRGRTNVMPAHADKLTPSQIRVLAAYVWGFTHRAPGPTQTAATPAAQSPKTP